MLKLAKFSFKFEGVPSGLNALIPLGVKEFQPKLYLVVPACCELTKVNATIQFDSRLNSALDFE
jgi:hypothetical protein